MHIASTEVRRYIICPVGCNEPSGLLIWHEGGDWCDRIPKPQLRGERAEWSCLVRSVRRLGSSQHEDKANARTGFYPTNLTGFGYHFGVFSREPSRNSMHDWNHVMVRYCDGGSFSGTVRRRAAAEPGAQGPAVLHMRGRAALKAVMKDLLESRGLAEASVVVVAGASAGGLGVLMQGDDWSRAISREAASRGLQAPKIALLVDSGFFPAFQASALSCRYRERMRAVHKLHRPTSLALKRCKASNPADPARCMFAAALVPFVETPLFAGLSAYDSWSIPRVLCTDDPRRITAHGEALRGELAEAFAASERPHGLYIDSCRHHGKCWHKPMVGGVSMDSAFSRWLGASPQRAMQWVDRAAYGSPACDAFYEEHSSRSGSTSHRALAAPGAAPERRDACREPPRAPQPPIAEAPPHPPRTETAGGQRNGARREASARSPSSGRCGGRALRPALRRPHGGLGPEPPQHRRHGDVPEHGREPPAQGEVRVLDPLPRGAVREREAVEVQVADAVEGGHVEPHLPRGSGVPGLEQPPSDVGHVADKFRIALDAWPQAVAVRDVFPGDDQVVPLGSRRSIWKSDYPVVLIDDFV
eukprot:CAMPEP_0177587562 /NCGR_PEP_ID=MMETSP0419_2-20121207/5724_1 /TAXON_ID=582737 /ORGANISM="Tetraselmis sp., Strain GSL018" /LENGTH=586 /DNA_ID=CAMNT_0019077633 /DNA_START=245 /DNA_END=2003 /DNA_ORIENTATION=+